MRDKLIQILCTPIHPRIGVDPVEALADYLIDSGVAVQEWISVEDRLPENDGRYLCNVQSFAFPGMFYQAILRYDKVGFRDGSIYTDDVTHWMPLPEPPKMDGGADNGKADG